MKQIRLEDEYKKKTGISPKDIAELRQWLQTQPHLPEKHITDLDLILAYHCCNRSTGVTKQVLDLNMTLRTLFTNFFGNRHYDHIEKIVTNILLTSLSMLTKEGYKVFYAYLLNNDPKIFHFADATKAAFMLFEICQYEEGTWPGLVIVIDCTGMSMGHIAKLDILSLQQYFYYLQEAMLGKLKSIHFINAPSFIDKMLTLIKPFTKKELMDILHIHTVGSTSLGKFIPIEALPNEAGGNTGTCIEHRDKVIAKLKDSASYFEEECHKRVTESLRPGRPKTISDLFGGIEGSFKKLEID